MALSGWCGQRGIPNCAGCRSTDCGCGCHGPKPQVNAANRTPVRVESETKRGPVRVNGTDPLTTGSILETNGG